MSLHPESAEVLKEIRTHAERKGLVLFVGSGISVGAVPLWNGLLEELLGAALEEAAMEDRRITPQCRLELLHWAQANYDVCAQASLIKQILGPARYRMELRDAIYRKIPDIEDELKSDLERTGPDFENSNFKPLWQVARLCLLPCIKAVATFNFDTLLETAIKHLGTRVSRSYTGELNHPAAIGDGRELPIYHVHGRLLPPASLARDPNQSVVFSYDEYFDRNADPLSWETSTPLHLLRNYCSLWLGASMKDWNMLRLLHGARSHFRHPHVYCLQSLREADGARAANKEIAMRFQATLFKSVGVKLAIAGPEYDDVWRVLDEEITKQLES